MKTIVNEIKIGLTGLAGLAGSMAIGDAVQWQALNANEMYMNSYRADISLTNDVMALEGKKYYIGGNGTSRVMQKLAGTGSIISYKFNQLNLLSSEIASGVKVSTYGGYVDMRYATPATVQHWTFDDEANPLAAPAGSVQFSTQQNVTNVVDTERGRVLSSTGETKIHGNINQNANFPTGNSPLTISMWVKVPSDATKKEGTFVSYGKTKEAFSMVVFRFYGAFNTLCFSCFGGTYDFTDLNLPISLNDDTWHHIAVRYDQKRFNLFLDGEKLSWFKDAVEGVPLKVYAGGTITIACDHHALDNAARYFQGCMDDVRIWNKALPDGAIYLQAKGAETSVEAAAQAPVAINNNYSGDVSLRGNARVSTIEGNAHRGSVTASGTLTVEGSGAAGETTTYFGGITGDASLVKRGANYDLVLSGKNTYTGGTHVQEGTLSVRGDACIVRRDFSFGDDCLGFWTFDDPLNIGGDSSATGTTLMPYTATVQPDSERGIVGHFNGTGAVSGGHVLTGALPNGALSGGKPYTISVWAKVPVSGGNDGGVFASVGTIGQAQKNKMIAFWFQSGSGYRELILSHWGGIYDFTNVKLPGDKAANDGLWHHYAAVLDTVENKFYVYFDGEPCVFSKNGNTPYAPYYANDPLIIPGNASVHAGRHFNNNTRNFIGELDDLGLWARAMSADEVRGIYRENIGKKCEIISGADALPKPVLEYAFDDPENIGKDTGPSGFDLSVMGSAQGTIECIPSPFGGRMLNFMQKNSSTHKHLGRAENVEPSFPSVMPAGGEDFTLTAWVRWNNILKNQTVPTFASIGVGAEEGCYYFDVVGGRYRFCGVNASAGVYELYQNSVYSTAMGMSVPENLGFVHYAATYSKASGLRIYINGVLQDVQGKSVTTKLALSHFFIGGRTINGTSRSWNGWLDNVRIYDKELSQEQIRKSMRADINGAGKILPEGGAVVVDAGASLAIDSHVQDADSISGSGTVRIGAQGCARVNDNWAFAGDIAGVGVVSVEAGATFAPVKGLESFEGDVCLNGGTLDLTDKSFGGNVIVNGGGKVLGTPAASVYFASGSEIVLDANTSLPFAAVDGVVRLAGNVTLKWREGEKVVPGTYVLARGTGVTGSVDGWRAEGFDEQKVVRFMVKDTSVEVSVTDRGTVIMMR